MRTRPMSRRPERRAKSFGLLGAAFGLGFIFGPMVGGLLGGIDLRLPFYVAAGAVAAERGLRLLRRAGIAAARDARAQFSLARANPLAALPALARRRDIGGLVVVVRAGRAGAADAAGRRGCSTRHFRFGWGPRDNGFALFCVGVVAAVVQGGAAGPADAALRRGARWSLPGLTTAPSPTSCYGLAQQGWMMYAIIVGNFLSFAAGPALQGMMSKARRRRASRA